MKRLCCLVLLASVTGCRLVRTAVQVPGETLRAATPGKEGRQAVDPVEVQQNLLRFADEFSTRMVRGVDELRRGTDPLPPAEVLKWKIAFTSQACSIATGPSSVAGLIDMTVFVSLTRMALEEPQQAGDFGESALPLTESCRLAEARIWQLAGKVLHADQQAELRQALTVWHQQQPLLANVVAAQAVGFAARTPSSDPATAASPSSVFSLLKMDPLSGLDPAMREIAQTRLLAERALFLTQKMPSLLRWQAELLSLNTLALPTVQQLISNSTQLAASAERFTAVVEKLPGEIRTERVEILKGLEAQETKLTPLVHEARETLLAGTSMSTSLNTTIATFDALMKRFGVGETNRTSAPKTNAEPFRVQDYGQTAAQLEGMARQLTELVRALDRTLGPTNLAQLAAQVGPVVEQAQVGGKELTDYAFRKGLLLLLIACVSALATALIYRFLSPRLALVKRG